MTMEKQNDSDLSMPEVIKNIRANAKMTQSELAERLGTNSARIGRFERGTTKPAYDEVEKLHEVSSECKTKFDRISESSKCISQRFLFYFFL